MIRHIKLTALTLTMYALALVIFPWSWLREQPNALMYAYWDTIGSAHRHVEGMWKGKK